MGIHGGRPDELMGKGCTKIGTVVKTETRDVRVLMIGLENAGKSKILYRLKFMEPTFTVPYTGYNVNVETLAPVRGLRFTIWDVGGGSRLRRMWQYYYGKTEALIFVVDCAEPARLGDAREVLLGVLGEQQLNGVPLLVMANKIDLDDCVEPSVIEDEFGLAGMTDRPWCVCGVSGKSGEGLAEAIVRLAELMENKNKL